MKHLFKFLFIGGINTVFFYLTYALFIFIGFHYTVAVTIAAVIAMFFSFKTFGKFVFKSNDNKLITKFILVTLINYLLNIIIIFFFKKFGYNSYLAGLFATIIVACNSFVLNKYYVFKKVN
ncbi:GtrA family protein [Sulfurimonas gotlandica]|uniref:GtrA family protein n=1 Tax=Sulfurimonas gotlandica TaxID=1176482 RepID=UPI000587EF8C